jgi:hypothetical protein
VAPDVGGSNLQGLDHGRHVASQGVKSHSFRRPGAFPSSPEIDSDRSVAGLRQGIRQALHVTDFKATTGQQNDRFTFTLAEVLNVRLADLDHS